MRAIFQNTNGHHDEIEAPHISIAINQDGTFMLVTAASEAEMLKRNIFGGVTNVVSFDIVDDTETEKSS